MKRSSILATFGCAFLAIGVWYWHRSPSEEAIPPNPEVVSSEAARPTHLPKPVIAVQQSAPDAQLIRSEADFLREFGSNWKLKRRPDGRVYRIQGDRLPQVGASKESAVAFMKRIAPLLGVEPEDLKGEVKVRGSDGSLKVYEISQHKGEYPVLDADVSVVANPETGDAVAVQSQLVPISSFTGAISVQQPSAMESAQQVAQGSHLEPDRAQPLAVYVGDDGKGELAWVFKTPRSEPAVQALKVIVSSSTGKVLKKIVISVVD